MKRLIIILFLSTFLSSCNQIIGCPDGAIEWVDLLKINDVTYQHQFEEASDEPLSTQIEKGEPVGKVTYKMADNACSDHKMRNGDAAYLEKGTTVYAVRGYPSSFMVVANDKVYVADQKKDAKTIGDIYPIKDLVKDIHVESTDDGRRIHTFSPEAKEKFLNEWLLLAVTDHMEMYKEKAFEGNRIFLGIELKNGISFRELYWSDTNAFHRGAYGNKKIQEVINQELAFIK
ncbi:hypothetical protein [Neobacillus niacini]|uniref:hypothetical protein n=1 Tax=Neobacillus niacini TaxID=86668 RepID=UPI0005EF076E|nr:hypothetical protein [Neobacillus niacini]